MALDVSETRRPSRVRNLGITYYIWLRPPHYGGNMAQVKDDPSAIGLTVPASLILREAGTHGTDTSR